MIDHEKLYAGIVYDTLRQLGLRDEEFLLSLEIRPVEPHSWCFGPAFTNRGRAISPDEDYSAIDAIRLEMYKVIKPGQVVVLQADDQYCAHSGDITSLIYQKLGCTGFVTDGIVRDSRRIAGLNFPCFVRNTNPIDALGSWGIVEYDVPVSLPGLGRRLVIRPLEWIYADADGVMRVPRELQVEFWKLLPENVEREETCREAFRKITNDKDVYDTVAAIFEKLGRW